MKHLIIILTVIVSLIFAGCLFDDDKSDKDSTIFTVTGRIVDNDAFGIDYATVMLEGTAIVDGKELAVSRRAATDKMGLYSIDFVKNGSYKITPYKFRYGFYPESRTVTVRNANAAVEVFYGYVTSDGGVENDPGTYAVSGSVVNSQSIGLDRVTVAISGGDIARSALTVRDGTFIFSSIPPGEYTIAPSDASYAFFPPYQTVYVRNANIYLDRFVAVDKYDSPDTEPVGNAGTHEYYPVNHGASWTYTVTETDESSGATDSYSESLHVMGVQSLNGSQYWKLVKGDGGFHAYLRVDGDVVYTFTEFAEFDDGDDGEDGDDGDGAGQLDEAYPQFRFDIAAGGTYEMLRYSSSDLGAFFSFLWTGEFEGYEDVTVIAGTFEKCRKYTLVYDAYAAGGGSTQRETTTFECWLAPDVGVVKSASVSIRGENVVGRVDRELVGYSIP